MKNEIVIGIPEAMIGRTKEEILLDAKWRLIHEVGHLLYTSNDAWDKFEDILKKLSGHEDIFYGTNKEILLNENND